MKDKEMELCKNCKDKGFYERFKYLQADFDNYKKYVDKEKEKFKKHANGELIIELLAVVDDLKSAIEKNKSKDAKEGNAMILGNLMAVLEKRGLKPIDALGKKFDPYYHEAMISELSSEEDGTVLMELQKGYMIGPGVIRHSKVKVSKSKKA